VGKRIFVFCCHNNICLQAKLEYSQATDSIAIRKSFSLVSSSFLSFSNVRSSFKLKIFFILSLSFAKKWIPTFRIFIVGGPFVQIDTQSNITLLHVIANHSLTR
jgi:hypothetical protein